MSHPTRALLLLLIAFSLTLAPATAEAAGFDRPGAFGSHTMIFSHMRSAQHTVLLDDAVQSGAVVARMDADWSAIELAPGIPQWHDLDASVNLALARQLDVVLMVAYTPPWASSCSIKPRYCPPTQY